MPAIAQKDATLVWDVDVETTLSKDVFANLKQIFGNRLKSTLYVDIKVGMVEMKFMLYKRRLVDNYYLPQYILETCDPSADKMLRIVFGYGLAQHYDPNVAYIAQIHKGSKMPGGSVLKFAIRILETLKVRKAYLHDASNVSCATDHSWVELALFKLLENGVTWYGSYGFQPDVEQAIVLVNGSHQETLDRFNAAVEAFRNMTTATVLQELADRRKRLLQCIESPTTVTMEFADPVQDMPNGELPIDVNTPSYERRLRVAAYDLYRYFNEAHNILERHIKRGAKFYETMLTVYADNCAHYTDVVYYLFDNAYFAWRSYNRSYALTFIYYNGNGKEKKRETVEFSWITHLQYIANLYHRGFLVKHLNKNIVYDAARLDTGKVAK